MSRYWWASFGEDLLMFVLLQRPLLGPGWFLKLAGTLGP